MARKRGCCRKIRIHEDNARFVLLAIVMVLYMLIGASIFMLLEATNEGQERTQYYEVFHDFVRKNPAVNVTELRILLRLHSVADNAGYVGDKRPRWNYAGSFYFVGTVVSTIGFGMTTPRTTAGKVFLIFYGFFGCAGTILFFNLFLERIITFLAYILRAVHEQELRRKGLMANGKGRRDSQMSSYDEDDNLDSWKPSVYWVMLILLLGALFVALCASAMYQPVEEWSYFESIYFCFVTFATIGFGDYVVSQKSEYPFVYLYRLGNFLFVVMGCCCIYSLFNVTSIVIKQMLNWILRKMDCRRSTCCGKNSKQRQRRNAITPGNVNRQAKATVTVNVSDAEYDSTESGESRRNSGEMISMRDFLQANKISLAMMQKQLWETAQRGAITSSSSGGLEGGVGPLAILNKKLGQTDM